MKKILTAMLILTTGCMLFAKPWYVKNKNRGKKKEITRDERENSEPFIKYSEKYSDPGKHEWKRVPCEKCNGTGSQVKVIEKEGNRVEKIMIMCPGCHGRGYTGFTKI